MGSSGLVESGSVEPAAVPHVRAGRAQGVTMTPRGGLHPGRDGGWAAEGAPVPAGPVGCARSPGQGPVCVEGALDIAEARVTGVRTEPRGAGTCTDAMARCRSPDVVDEHEAM